MRLLVLFVLAAGCGFRTAAGTADGSVPPDEDAPPADAIDAPVDMSLPISPWTRRKTITVDNTRVSGGPHAGFPLLIKLASDPNLATDAQPSGGDIKFVADDMTPLPYQRQRFVKATGELIAWVRIPSLPAGAPTTIHMYYGNPTAADQQDVAGTWGQSYRGVWHLDETVGGTSAVKDSSTFANHGTDENAPTFNAAGQIGGAVTFDGTNDRIRIPDSASLDTTGASATFEMWVRFVDPSTANKFQLVLSNSNTFGANRDGYSWSTQADGDHYFYPWAGDTNDFQLATNPFTNNWAFAAVTFAFATKTVSMYVNGQPVSTTGMTANLWTQTANPGDWLWGGNPLDAGNHFAGQLDELRVSSIVRGPGWILTEYRNQSSPQTFYSVGVATSL